MHFRKGEEADLDEKIHQTFEVFVTIMSGSAGFSFLKSILRLINLSWCGNTPKTLGRLFFFDANLISLIKIDGRLRPIAIAAR